MVARSANKKSTGKTAKSSSKKGGKAAKGSAKTGRKRPKAVVTGSPIIITGGSMSVEFNPQFKDTDATPSLGHKKIKKVDHPVNARKITAVVVTDRSNPPVQLNRYDIPVDLNGMCRVIIISD